MTGAAALLNSGEFDPCTVQTRPTDLLRRRQRVRVAVALAAVAAIGVVVAAVPGGDDRPAPPRPSPSRPWTRPGCCVPQRAVGRHLRVDFTAWPARGRQAGDRELLGRALRVWAAPPEGTRITAAAGTSTRPPGHPPQLLYAGLIDNVMVVVLYDGERLVRYAEPEDATPTLHFARVDAADVTTAAGLVIGRGNGWMRYLLAPWISDVASRDLLAPGAPPHGLHVAPDGVTDRIPTRPGGRRLRTLAGGAVPPLDAARREHPAFLLADLDDLVPVHLTSGPPASGGAPEPGRTRRPTRRRCGPGRVPRARSGRCGAPAYGPSTTGRSPSSPCPRAAAGRPGSAPAPTPGAAPAA
ncbi:hypothetical protein PQR15_26395 [Streptomyces lydicus]|nr:hypothetical protein [Streptomyces lydicus]